MDEVDDAFSINSERPRAVNRIRCLFASGSGAAPSLTRFMDHEAAKASAGP
jgi:hypothetical protein